jgi:hypothetical protein
MNRTKLTAFALALVLISGGVGVQVGAAQRKASLKKQYLEILNEADGLWSQYQKEVKAFHEKGKVSTAEHVKRIWDLQLRLSRTYNKWVEFPAPESIAADDVKVGLAMQLQMAAMSAELTAMISEDDGFLDLADVLDKDYKKVLNTM